MLTFVKLGGSLITDKRVENSFRAETAAHIASQIQTALAQDNTLQLLIGHGSGSFGHVVAKRYGTMDGVHTDEQWRGFAHVATVASELSYLMTKALESAGIAVMRFQPSASAISQDGRITEMCIDPIRHALQHGLVPLVHGDVAFDDTRGGTIISTETIFFYLARHLPVERVLLLGEVEGVYDSDDAVIPTIMPQTLPEVERALGGSAGTDVTGGMETKVRDMVSLVQASPQISIRIMSGQQPDLLRETLLNRATPGTLICAG